MECIRHLLQRAVYTIKNILSFSRSLPTSPQLITLSSQRKTEKRLIVA